MKAIDTNVLIRAITRDDPRQSSIANDIIASGVFVTSGVWIETEWVLRFSYRWPRERIAQALTAFAGLDVVHADRPDGLRWALDRYAQGADWADMIHLIDSEDVEQFATFDRALVRDAGSRSPTNIELLA